MKKMINLLVAVTALVCSQFQSAKAQNSYTIVKMEISLKYSANISKMLMFVEDSTDFEKKFPAEYHSLAMSWHYCGKYCVKARHAYLWHCMRRYKKLIAQAGDYYTSSLAIYNSLLAKEGKSTYQEITTEDDIVRVRIMALVWMDQKKAERKIKK